MRVWTYPDRKYEELGSERFLVEWETARRPPTEGEDLDYDRDIIYNARPFKTKAAAMRFAKKVYGDSFFGAARVTKEVVGWYVEEDRVAEWQTVGATEEVSR